MIKPTASKLQFL